ncbi:MAG: maleate cis-trans isomerase [Dehalococcoidia bacterium]|jgi:maleate isomerase|nr:MAG: maleate cis-trans isomerase [Dehalococcoidia bacterium]
MRRKRIGLLIPSPNVVAEPELGRRLPDNVSLHTARMYWTRGGEAEMLDRYLPDALRDLASLHPDVVIFACTTAGALRGNASEQALIRSIEEATGAPAISVLAESIAALRRIGARHVGVLTPYPEEDNHHIAAALGEAGVDVVAIDGLRLPGVASPELTADDLIPFGRHVLTGKRFDAVFIACTNLFTIDALPAFEAAFGAPVVSTLAAAREAALRALAQPAAPDTVALSS